MIFNYIHFKDNRKTSVNEIYKYKYYRIFEVNKSCLGGTSTEVKDAIAFWVNYMKKFRGDYKKPAKFIPAGYTYLGQFIAHDLSFDSKTISCKKNKSEDTYNLNTAALDLDSIYRNKDKKKSNFLEADIKFTTHESSKTGKKPLTKAKCPLSDNRNGEHILISQLHIAFQKFHNKIADSILSNSNNTDYYKIYKKIKQEVIWTYQWLIVHDFLLKFVPRQIIDKIKKEGNKFYHPHPKDIKIPLEFSVAAFRFGHSIVKEQYTFSDKNNKRTGKDMKNLLSFSQNQLDWSMFFFDLKEKGTLNYAEYIDPSINNNLHRFPKNNPFFNNANIVGNNLAEMNLNTSNFHKLCSGEYISKRMFPRREIIKLKGAEKYSGNTPLWIYILYEAYHVQGGKKLGPIGSHLVTEVIYELIRIDDNSYLNRQIDWKPRVETFQAFLEYARVY